MLKHEAWIKNNLPGFEVSEPSKHLCCDHDVVVGVVVVVVRRGGGGGGGGLTLLQHH